VVQWNNSDSITWSTKCSQYAPTMSTIQPQKWMSPDDDAAWVSFKNTILSEKSQTQGQSMSYLILLIRNVHPHKTKAGPSVSPPQGTGSTYKTTRRESGGKVQTWAVHRAAEAYRLIWNVAGPEMWECRAHTGIKKLTLNTEFQVSQ
jgi:hypothetical protein